MISFVAKIIKPSSGFNNYVAQINSELKKFPTDSCAKRIINIESEDVKIGSFIIVWSAEINKDTRECFVKEYIEIPQKIFDIEPVVVKRTKSDIPFNSEEIINDKVFPVDVPPLYL